MIKIPLFALAIFILFPFNITAGGKNEQEEIKKINDQWVLCITEFDVQAVPADKLGISTHISRKITENIKVINTHIRVSSEYYYYEGQAWAQSTSKAAQALSKKQDERSLLLFRGDSDWTYRQNLKKIDTEIEKLQEALEKIQSEAPLINSEPEFSITKANNEFNFPKPPKNGTEKKFCISQKADALLTGSVMDFHGRYYVTVKLYTLYTDSFVYEDEIIFSPEDLDGAVDSLTEKLIIALSSDSPAAIMVKAKPDNALILINKSFAGKGNTDITEHPPGKVIITASAQNHETMTIETELTGGELTEIDINLKPIDYGLAEISGISKKGSVYYGALFMGETPLQLSLPLNTFEFVELETSRREIGRVVFQGPSEPNETIYLSLKTRNPPEKGRVDRARRMYYWAWGGTWLSGITAWILYQSYITMETPFSSFNDGEQQIFSNNYVNEYNKMYHLSMGAMLVAGAAIAYEIYHIGRYLYIANEGSTSLVKPQKKSQAERK